MNSNGKPATTRTEKPFNGSVVSSIEAFLLELSCATPDELQQALEEIDRKIQQLNTTAKFIRSFVNTGEKASEDNPGKGISPEQRQQIYGLADQGKGIDAIAQQLDLPRKSVSVCLGKRKAPAS